jgi:hypothetical protein
MRPIDKGAWPVDEHGAKIVFTDHKQAKIHLTNRTGMYCHLCEMRIDNVPSIEHIKHQKHSPNLKLHWDNFLLACTYCNSRKPKSPIKTYHYYWPHLHNTYLPFNYQNPLENAGIFVNTSLSAVEQQKAAKTLELYGLQEVADNAGNIDSRYQARREAFSKALQCLIEYETGQIILKAITREATSTGFWSVWFTIFQKHAEVRKALLDAFRGTEANCFDRTAGYVPIKRTAAM